MRTLALQRPLLFVDLETTGPNPAVDSIVQIALVKLKPDGTSTRWQSLINPGKPIPPDATAVHGITDEKVANAPAFSSVARAMAKSVEGCDVAGFNVRRFDWPCLKAELERAGVKVEWKPVLVDAMQVFFHFNPRDLKAAVRTYLGREHEGAHDAAADVQATVDVLLAQLERHPELPESPEAMAAFLNPVDPNAVDEEGYFKRQGDAVVVAFGKSAGTLLTEVKASFLTWVRDGDFPEDTKSVVVAELQRRKREDPTVVDADGKLKWQGDEVVIAFGKNAGTPLAKAEKKFLKWMLGNDFSAEVKAIVTEALAGRFPKKERAA